MVFLQHDPCQGAQATINWLRELLLNAVLSSSHPFSFCTFHFHLLTLHSSPTTVQFIPPGMSAQLNSNPIINVLVESLILPEFDTADNLVKEAGNFLSLVQNLADHDQILFWGMISTRYHQLDQFHCSLQAGWWAVAHYISPDNDVLKESTGSRPLHCSLLFRVEPLVDMVLQFDANQQTYYVDFDRHRLMLAIDGVLGAINALKLH
ncbi:hypothetical protein TREMEDRAFT_65027 [Tremella mesenterica DSM 1558]|uniref:uncharacterized protein n=1 Tax=Tremella mesenterica (strain ATCC 24925 / CBS 8224 / DSM 1558 / NBRC 9311 / NRRL Y-6157 / RJB 2259-6 / UBC 559-6) TaxID=578456 RepID=UPI00032CF3D4|nr:uncharacterized protein TREMEDRAFT_65027 [Tremella mesenterica DSM 1558]EIW66645.1 hypothetical protein TREMEDRAFT_65027 [Tremella mesenterica DSM 1558]